MNGKIVRQLCFTKSKGEKALNIYDNPSYGRSKSEVVIELLLLYKDMEDLFGEDAFFEMKSMLKKLKKEKGME